MADIGNSSPARPNRTELRWNARYREFLKHLAAVGSMPRETDLVRSVSSVEFRLAGWVRYQRRRYRRGLMPLWQFVLLDEVQQFEWEPLDDSWAWHIDELRSFLDSENRMPRYRSHEPGERALGAWVHKQRHLYQRQALSADRVAFLRQLPFKIL